MNLGIATVEADQAAFAQPGGARLEAIASRLTAGTAPWAGALVVRPGVEVRATGDLTLAADWTLPTADPTARTTAPHIGSTSATLRAAGSLNVAHSLSSGFQPVSAFDAATQAAVDDRGGSIRLIAGADLAAADSRATAGGATGNASGDLLIGRAAPLPFLPPPTVTVRSTTGSIEAHAARDVSLLNSAATVYTTGTHAQPSTGLSSISTDLLNGENGPLSPFLDGGGSIDVSAGRDVLGVAPTAERPYITDWWWRASSNGVRAWWSRYDLFDQGLATFGGGDVKVGAGRDAVNLHAAAAGSGAARGSEQAPLVEQHGGGRVSVAAGRDVVNGLLYAAGDSLQVSAKGSLRREAGSSVLPDPGLQLVHESTAVQLDAGRDILLASVRSAGMTGAVPANTSQGADTVIAGLARGSSLAVQSTAGSIEYRGADQPVAEGNSLTADLSVLGTVLPESVRFAAPNGAIRFGGQNVIVPAAQAHLQWLARDEVVVNDLTVTTTRSDTRIDARVALDEVTAIDLARRADGATADRSDRAPVRVVSETADVRVENLLASARPVRVLAGADVLLGPAARLLVQHQPQQLDRSGAALAPISESSLLRAGRDITASAASGSTSGIEIAGSGDLMLVAGRHIDLGGSQGITATGNRDNGTVLPAGGANISLIAGLRADSSDYARAVREGHGLLGASALGERAGDVYALLAGSASGTLGSIAAREFDALPVTQQLDRVRELLGIPRYATAVAGFVRGLPGKAALSDATAMAEFAALPEWQRAMAAGSMLTRSFGDLPLPTRAAFAASVAAASASAADRARAQGLVDYLNTVTGVAPSNLEAAQQAFEALPLERQMVWLNRVMVDELRQQGRAAAQASGADRQAAYARGYRAIDAVFPATSALPRVGDIRLPTSQIRTAQRGDIVLAAPGGGVNAGELVGGSSARAADLGIVTVAGGNISAVVRDDFEVNQSRVFSLKQGDVLLWASEGNIDAGRGAKTVTGAPAPVLRLDSQGRLTLDTSGSFSGSGIAVLDRDSSLDLYAPQGEINAGEAGIKSLGNAFFGAVTFRGADNLSVGGAAVGAPPPPPSTGATAGLAATSTSAGGAAAQNGGEETEEERRRKRRARRDLMLEFLGFGERS